MTIRERKSSMPFKIIAGDILEQEADAIVIPAVPRKGAVSEFTKAVYDAAGYDAMLAERRKFGHLKKCCSAVTSGCDLKAKYVIHTAVPYWNSCLENESEKLAECYLSALRQAEGICAASVAFPLLGAAKNGFPVEIAKRIAEKAITEFLADGKMLTVYLVIMYDTAQKLNEKYGLYDRLWGYEKKLENAVLSSGADKSEFYRKKFGEYLYKYIPNNEQLANLINYDKSCISKLISGKIHRPKKKHVLAMAIGMELSDEDRYIFVNCAGYKYPEDKRDELIEELMLSGNRDFHSINEILIKRNAEWSLNEVVIEKEQRTKCRDRDKQ